MDDADEVYLRDELAEYGILYGFIPDGEELTTADIDAVIKRHKRSDGVWDPERSATPDSNIPAGELFRTPFAVSYVSYVHVHELGWGRMTGDITTDAHVSHEDTGLSPEATKKLGIDFYGDKTQYDNTTHIEFEADTASQVRKELMPSYMVVYVAVYGVGTRFCVLASCVAAHARRELYNELPQQLMHFEHGFPYLVDHSTPGYSWCLGLLLNTGDFEEPLLLPVLSSTFIRQSVLEDSGDEYEWDTSPVIEASDGEQWVMLTDTTTEEWAAVTEVAPYIMEKYLERITDEPRNFVLRGVMLGFEPLDTFMGYM